MNSLLESLLLLACFDHGIDADFAKGVSTLHTLKGTVQGENISYDVHPGLGDSSVTLEAAAGRFGGALVFHEPDPHGFAFYPAVKNVRYSEDRFDGSFSIWIKADPSKMGGKYADPVQIGDKGATDSSIWIDFTKNDEPPDFRLGIFGNQVEWDPDGQGGQAEAFFFRLHKVALPPFSEADWTHVVVTWESINDTEQAGRGRLYLNGIYQGATGFIPEKLTWDIQQTAIRLGMGPFVGSLDELAMFDRALNAEEVNELFHAGKSLKEYFGL